MESNAIITTHSAMDPHINLLTGCGDKDRLSFMALKMTTPRLNVMNTMTICNEMKGRGAKISLNVATELCS